MFGSAASFYLFFFPLPGWVNRQKKRLDLDAVILNKNLFERFLYPEQMNSEFMFKYV